MKNSAFSDAASGRARGLGKVVRSGVRRRKLQTFVTGLSTMMAVTASVLGGSLLVASQAPFEQAFGQQHGAHLSAEFDGGRATAAQVAATGHAAGVVAVAGPFAQVTVSPAADPDAHLPPGLVPSPMTLDGRADPGGAVDDVTLTEGTWVAGPGQVVVSVDLRSDFVRPGKTLRFPGLPGSPTLMVVGVARSVSKTADGWVAPGEISSLTSSGGGVQYRMAYRFAAADTAAQVAADRAVLGDAAPAGALTGAQSWLDLKQGSDRNTALFVPFLTAYGLLGVLMSVLTVGSVVAGAVGAGTRRIGVLKSLGYTPAQVVRSYIGQALIPSGIGVVVGVLAGNALAAPVLSSTADVYGTTASVVTPSVDIAAIVGALALVTVTAWLAALRAGRLRAVDALVAGRAPTGRRGRGVARFAARLPLPRSVTMGLAHPFARPARTASLVATVAFGTVAVTFAVGMAGSLNWAQEAKSHESGDVTVRALAPRSAGESDTGPADAATAAQDAKAAGVDPAAITSAIAAQSGTQASYSITQTDVTVAGITGTTTVFAFGGDSSFADYKLVSGTWFAKPGEGVVPTTLLTATSTKVGDTITLQDHGRSIPIRIVGEVFDPSTRTGEVLTDVATLGQTDLHPLRYYIKTKPGTNARSYLDSLNAALQPLGLAAEATQTGQVNATVVTLDLLTAVLTLMLVAVAAMGVLNSVMLATRERVRDVGVAKALGMTPRQTTAMVFASVLVIGLIGGAIGLPLGLLIHGLTVPAMAHSAGITFPAAAVDIYSGSELALLGVGGLAIAGLGALSPALWAAKTRTVSALRVE